MATAIEGICPRLWRIIQGTRTEVREYGLHLDKSLTPWDFRGTDPYRLSRDPQRGHPSGRSRTQFERVITVRVTPITRRKTMEPQ